jgi:hypothetical protein
MLLKLRNLRLLDGPEARDGRITLQTSSQLLVSASAATENLDPQYQHDSIEIINRILFMRHA